MDLLRIQLPEMVFLIFGIMNLSVTSDWMVNGDLSGGTQAYLVFPLLMTISILKSLIPGRVIATME
jgi:hypothetical protein